MNNKVYDNRELSWLKFNERVLEEAQDSATPLLERLLFQSIFASNLDEFFRVRVGSLYDSSLVDDDHKDNKSKMRPSEQLSAIFERVHELIPIKDKTYKAICEELELKNIVHKNIKALTEQDKKFLEAYYAYEVKPFLNAFIIDKRHPFPFLANQSIYAVAKLASKSAVTVGIVSCNEKFQRVIFLPDDEQRVRERTRSDISDYERGLLTIFGLTHLSQGSSGTGGISSYEPMSPPRNQILAGKGVQPSQNLHRIIGARSLSKTTQGWEKDGEGNLTYNSPIETVQKLDFHQGKVENFGGTCGLCSCENVLRMAGVSVSEADIVRYASTTYEDANNSFVASLTGRTLCRTGSAPSSNGGTSAKARKKILEHFGVPSYTATQSIETIADAVSTGHGVIASVHAERLYFKRRPIHADLHAITITSVKKDNTGSILGFYVCDSNAFALGGTGATYYTAEEIEEALSERECNITSTIIR